jgi:hypothetical protein
MRIEQRKWRKYQAQGSVQRCQKQKMPFAGGVAGTAPGSAMTSKRSVSPTSRSTNATTRGTTASAIRWLKVNCGGSLEVTPRL